MKIERTEQNKTKHCLSTQRELQKFMDGENIKPVSLSLES